MIHAANLARLVMAIHAGVSTEAFASRVRDWIGKARHPRLDRPFTSLVDQPMLDVLALLREAKLHVFDDREGKPVAINRHIGRRPIAAFGNSDGDFAILKMGNKRPRGAGSVT